MLLESLVTLPENSLVQVSLMIIVIDDCHIFIVQAIGLNSMVQTSLHLISKVWLLPKLWPV